MTIARAGLAGLCLVPGLALGACASGSYAGIPLEPGAADADLQQLARQARSGDQQAQLALGIRYEEGRGVPVDLGRAERLFQKAAKARGGTSLVYIPSSRPGGRGSTVPLAQGPRVPGLAEAELRLRRLRNRRETGGTHE